MIEAEQAAQQAALSQAKATQKPVARKHRKPLPLGKIAFGLIVLALLVALVLPYVYPLNEYIAPLEQRLSAHLKQPVHIGGMSASFVASQAATAERDSGQCAGSEGRQHRAEF